MTDEEWRQFDRRVAAEDRALARVVGYALLLVVPVLAAVLVSGVLADKPAPVRQPPVSMRCFPEGTILPETMDFLGRRHPGLPGCIDYRLNEGMEI